MRQFYCALKITYSPILFLLLIRIPLVHQRLECLGVLDDAADTVQGAGHQFKHTDYLARHWIRPEDALFMGSPETETLVIGTSVNQHNAISPLLAAPDAFGDKSAASTEAPLFLKNGEWRQYDSLRRTDGSLYADPAEAYVADGLTVQVCDERQVRIKSGILAQIENEIGFPVVAKGQTMDAADLIVIPGTFGADNKFFHFVRLYGIINKYCIKGVFDMKERGDILKLASILMLFGSIIRAFMGITFSSFFATVISMWKINGSGDPRLAIATMVLIYTGALVALIASIVGMVNCEEPSHSKPCIYWGIASCAVCFAANIMQYIVGYGVSSVVFVTGFVLPAIYLFGAVFLWTGRKRK